MDKKQTENNNKIPKIIHYCWFGGKPIPEELRACMDSWKKLKGYKVIRWDETNCSFNENEFVRRTYAEKKLGFIGDYYRLKAVYEYGGIYLDTDVMINRSFDGLLSHTAFLNFIFDKCWQAHQHLSTPSFSVDSKSRFITKLKMNVFVYDKQI